MNAAGEPTGEKILFKEDAQKAGGEIISTLKGLKGSKLKEYMKKHFQSSWEKIDVNEEGSIAMEESHTFQRGLMGRLNQFSLAQGSISDVNAL
mmetsp:Transcript_16420/g.25366  ORF Transcript_16420/g.25366 Transcript_16420/m.25366 type:complete len:93 (+) Transcript_16420:614-892(+)|eukprot:CAMPEP_0170487000 /NCGR_PEP_ID=MMETSP0208-20121228/5875_1 /TAXON_ID=197538 /ORGANISM="Strombidium inclinatum, Strain S3" /LENGTH=92 /DNA_ID=CAMNT_0010761103 /DNA_START=611 /DNA_END=889 /DNA_ORIENTATION=-